MTDDPAPIDEEPDAFAYSRAFQAPSEVVFLTVRSGQDVSCRVTTEVHGSFDVDRGILGYNRVWFEPGDEYDMSVVLRRNSILVAHEGRSSDTVENAALADVFVTSYRTGGGAGVDNQTTLRSLVAGFDMDPEADNVLNVDCTETPEILDVRVASDFRILTSFHADEGTSVSAWPPLIRSQAEVIEDSVSMSADGGLVVTQVMSMLNGDDLAEYDDLHLEVQNPGGAQALSPDAEGEVRFTNLSEATGEYGITIKRTSLNEREIVGILAEFEPLALDLDA